MLHLCEAPFFGLSFMVAVRRAPLWRAGSPSVPVY
ncbi:UNVERIFIED_ORG: hypothetical protein EDF86_2643 [Pseudomonas psychrophila]